MGHTINSRSRPPGRWPLYVVPHSHFDLIWRRPVAWYRKRRAVVYRAALDLLEERPDFRYSFCQALGLQWFFRDHPAEQPRFRRLIKEGRLELIGGPLTIPDLNLSHGESIARNQLAGLDWLEQSLGTRPATACMEDAFGVPSSLPALLRSCGMTFYRSSRMPRPGRRDLSGPMLWPGHDGTVLPACGPEGMAWGLGQPSNIDQSPNDFAGMVEQYRRDLKACPWDGSRPVLFSFLGEEHVPSHENVEAFLEAIQSLHLPFRWATAAEFLEALRDSGAVKRAPVVRDDLSRLFTGCYSSRIRQKRPIADLEASLLAAENMGAAAGSSVAALAGPWSDLFLMQFHDAYGGCHTPENAVFMNRVLVRAQARVSQRVAGRQLGNPLLFDRALPFIVPAGLPKRGRTPVVAQAFDGEAIAVHPLPALASASVNVNVVAPETLAKPRRLKTRHARLMLDAGGNRLIVKGQAMPVPGLLRVREDVGTLWTEDYTGREWRESPVHASLDHAEEGPVFSRAVWTGSLRYGPGLWSGFTALHWRRSLLLFKDAPWLWLRLEFDWSGNSTEIGWSFNPMGRRLPNAVGSMPFGVVGRPVYAPGRDGLTGDVFPSPHWAGVHDATCAWLVLHRGQPAFRVVAGGLENIMLRSPVKRWMPFFPVSPDGASWENGHHVADFLLVPQRTFDPAEAMRLGLAFQTGVPATRSIHAPPALTRIVASLPEAVVASSLAREGKSWRLRLCEARGRDIRWSVPRGWAAELRTFAGDRASSTGSAIRIPALWMGDLWLTPPHE